jgi:hypothetical protein
MLQVNKLCLYYNMAAAEVEPHLSYRCCVIRSMPQSCYVVPCTQHCLTSKAMRSERNSGGALLFSSLVAVWQTCRARLRCLPAAAAGLTAANCCVASALQQHAMYHSSVIVKPSEAGCVNPATSSLSSDVDVKAQQHSNA